MPLSTGRIAGSGCVALVEFGSSLSVQYGTVTAGLFSKVILMPYRREFFYFALCQQKRVFAFDDRIIVCDVLCCFCITVMFHSVFSVLTNFLYSSILSYLFHYLLRLIP